MNELNGIRFDESNRIRSDKEGYEFGRSALGIRLQPHDGGNPRADSQGAAEKGKRLV